MLIHCPVLLTWFGHVYVQTASQKRAALSAQAAVRHSIITSSTVKKAWKEHPSGILLNVLVPTGNTLVFGSRYTIMLCSE